MAFRATRFLRHAFTPRPAFELALRASCLQLVLARWGLETAALMGMQGEATANDSARKERAVEAIASAMYESGLDDHMTEAEKSMLDRPYRTWQYDDYQYGDHWESLGVLQWLLGRQHQIPAYYNNFDRANVFRATGIQPAQPQSIAQFVDSFMAPQQHLNVDQKLLQREIDIAEAWSWRARAQALLQLRAEIARTEQGHDQAPLQEAMRAKRIPQSLKKIAKELPNTIPAAARRAFERGIIDGLENDDFAITVELKEGKDQDGRPATTTVPYTHLDSAHHDAIRKIADARLMAFAWSVDKLDQWDQDKMAEITSINPIVSIWTPQDE
ncbi:hypothetical protein EC988_001034 [Linderina pennispora]|nr:hypothetical protein EC988_001034 [Linderina pennispora]